jgi:large subunit ribosomal protein L15
MPLQRRIPKFGFKNINRVEYHVVNLDTLQALLEKSPGAEVNHEFLREHGLISSAKDLVKVLGRGELTVKADVKLNKFSQSAKAAIEAAGGTVTEV